MSDNETHSRLSPSAASRWVNCPGSITMCEQFPEPQVRNEAADEGTASHWIGSEVLLGVVTPVVGSKAPNGIVIDMEMIEGAEVYTAAVRHVAGSAQLHVEEKLCAEYIHPICFGTPDCWFLSGRELHVWDYKYGYNIVDPFENWQLICYTAGIVQKLGSDSDLTVIMHIVQPRPFHNMGPHRTWRVSAADLRTYYIRLAGAANEAFGPAPKCASGDHCKYCRARHACVTLQNNCMAGIDYVGQSVPQLLSPEAMSIEKRVISRIKNLLTYRETGLDAQIEAVIKAGGMVPGWALQQGQGRMAWTATSADVFALGDLMGIDLRAEPEPITPAKASKLGLSKEIMASYAAAGNSGVKLVPTANSLASRVFRS
jgi:hypothetical protein